MGKLEHTRLLRFRPAERALLVPEQFALYQVIRQRAAVDVHPGPLAPQGQVVQRARHNLFARSALSANQDRGVSARDLLHQAKHGLHPRASHYCAAYDVVVVLGLRRLEMVLWVPRVRLPVLLVIAGYGAMQVEAVRGAAS